MRHVADCAVSLGFLLDFARNVPDGLSTAEVVQQIIVPSTGEHRCRYVGLPSVPASAVGRSQYFISHRWAADFTRELVALVARHFADTAEASTATLQRPAPSTSPALAPRKPDAAIAYASGRPSNCGLGTSKQDELPSDRPSSNCRPSAAAASASGVYLGGPASPLAGAPRAADSTPPSGPAPPLIGSPQQPPEPSDAVSDSRPGSHPASWRASAPVSPLPPKPPAGPSTSPAPTTTTSTSHSHNIPCPATAPYPPLTSMRTLSRLRAGRDTHPVAAGCGATLGACGGGFPTTQDGRPSWTGSGSGACEEPLLPGAPAGRDTGSGADGELSPSGSLNPLLARPSYQEDVVQPQHLQPQQQQQQQQWPHPRLGSCRSRASGTSLSAGGTSLSRVAAAAAAAAALGPVSGSGQRGSVTEVGAEGSARSGGECRTLDASRSPSLALPALAPSPTGRVCTARTTRIGSGSGRSTGQGMLGGTGSSWEPAGGGGGSSLGHVQSLREKLCRVASASGEGGGGGGGAVAVVSGSSEASDAAVAEVVASTASSSSARSRSSHAARSAAAAAAAAEDGALVAGVGLRGTYGSGYGGCGADGSSCVTTNAELVNRLRTRFVGREELLDGTYVWLDIFAINQHPSSAQVDDLSKLQDVVGASDATLLVLDRGGQVLTRIWCLYEIWQTVRKKGPKALQVLGASLEHGHLLQVWGQLDVERAQATVDADRVRILGDIRTTTGTEGLNHHIKRALLESANLDLDHARAIAPRTPLHGEAAFRAAALARVSGSPAPALAAAREAADVLCGCCGPSHEATLRSLRAVAGCHKDLGALSHALGLLQQQVLPYLEADRGPDDEDYGVLSDVGALHHTLGQYDTAYDFMLMALVQQLRRLHHAVPYATSQLAAPLASGPAAIAASSLAAGGYLVHPADAVRLVPLSDDHLSVVLAALQSLAEEAEARGGRGVVAAAAAQPASSSLQGAAAGAAAGGGPSRLGENVQMIGEAVGLVLHSLALVQKDRALRRRSSDSSSQLREAREMMEVSVRLLDVFSGANRGMAASDARANLAALVLDAGDYQTAERLLRSNLALTESVYGSEHLHTATALNNLAMCLKRQKARSPGKAAEAEALYRRCLAVVGASLGEAHSETLVVATNLGVLLADQGQLAEAEDLLCRAVANLPTWQLGTYHPDVLAAHKRLAEVLELRSKLFEAEAVFRITLQYAEAAAPECRDHGVVLECREGLARVQELMEAAARARGGASCCTVS